MNITFIRMTLLASLIAATSVSAQDERSLSNRVAELEQKLEKLESKDGQELHGYWKNGFMLEDRDKSFRLMLGGRTQLDTAFFSADEELETASGDFDDGVKFRRVRLYMRGSMYDKVEFTTEYEFTGGGSFQSVYLGLKEVPVIGNIRVGHLLEPMGLEEIASNNHITFMERGTTTSINPVFNTGVMAFDEFAGQRMTWALGLFKETGSFGDSVSNETWATTARLTGLPYETDDGRKYLHLGASASWRNVDEEPYRIRSRPQSSIAPNVADTKSIAADSVDLYALEALLTLDSFSLQSEWITSAVDRRPDGETPAADDVEFESYYVMASYFLTGEYRPYVKNSGIAGRVIPEQNAAGDNWGAGAWEICARYDFIDLNDADIRGGEMETYTFGLNWYLTPHTRIMWNYVAADVKDTGQVDIFEMRFQVDL